MYSYITGRIQSVSPTSVVLDNGGLGFLIHISLQTYSRIKDEKEVRLLTHCVLKNESQAVSTYAIYGFADETERSLFMDLISVSGVGNNTAQLILSSIEPSTLVSVIASGDSASLQRVKGIGAKTAQRIIIDLRDKVARTAVPALISSAGGNTQRSESLSALLTLGFGRAAAEKAVDKAIAKGSASASVEEIIKLALGFLAS